MRRALIFVALLAVASPARADDGDEVHSFGYARLGYGGVFADRTHGAPAIGFGFRGELESFALDISFFNFILDTNVEDAMPAFAGSTVRLQALRYLNPDADRSTYVGAGLSWGGVSAGREATFTSYLNDWHGSGLQGELTVGYELPRKRPLRMFVQADVGLPFFYARSQEGRLSRIAPGVFLETTYEKRYIPSAAVSVGIGWHRR
jgi:hypothetical protein